MAWKKDRNNDWSKASVYVRMGCAPHKCRHAVKGLVEGVQGTYHQCDELTQQQVIAELPNGCDHAEVVSGQPGTMTRQGFIPKEE